MENEFNLEAKFYDKTWGKYDYDSDIEFLDNLFKENDCKSVIDVGCGTGNHALILSRLGYEVTAVDISSSMIKKAKEKDREARIQFLRGDMRELERVVPPGQKFDAAICLGQTFCNLITNRDIQRFFKGLHKVLKRNGLFIFNARNARKISEDYLNKLLLDHMIIEEKLQLLLLFYNTRHPQNRNVIIWRPIYLMKENDKVDLQLREHKLRWFDFSRLKKMLIKNGFKITAIYSGTTKEEFKEDKHREMWFITIAL